MILVLFFIAVWILWFLVMATLFVFWVGAWILAFAVAIVIEISRALIERRRPKKPKTHLHYRPIPQARWSDRR